MTNDNNRTYLVSFGVLYRTFAPPHPLQNKKKHFGIGNAGTTALSCFRMHLPPMFAYLGNQAQCYPRQAAGRGTPMWDCISNHTAASAFSPGSQHPPEAPNKRHNNNEDSRFLQVLSGRCYARNKQVKAPGHNNAQPQPAAAAAGNNDNSRKQDGANLHRKPPHGRV